MKNLQEVDNSNSDTIKITVEHRDCKGNLKNAKTNCLLIPPGTYVDLLVIHIIDIINNLHWSWHRILIGMREEYNNKVQDK